VVLCKDKEKETYEIILDDEVDNAMVIGGFRQSKPLVVRSDGYNCRNNFVMMTRKELRSGQWWIHPGATFVKRVGVIICGGQAFPTRSGQGQPIAGCRILDPTRPKMGPFTLVNKGRDEPSAGPAQLVVYRRRVYYYAEADNDLYEGKLASNGKCPPAAAERKPCPRHTVKWSRLHLDLGFNYGNAALKYWPCVVQRDRDLFLVGGLSSSFNPVRSVIRVDLETKAVEAVDEMLLPPPPRVYHGCADVEGRILVSGGVYHPPTHERGGQLTRAFSRQSISFNLGRWKFDGKMRVHR